MELLAKTSRTLTIKINDSNPYFSKEEFNIYLNNSFYKKEHRNVFTIYNLNPNTNYQIKVNDHLSSFTTDNESVLINVRDFFAIGDGVNDDTVKIQAAISCAPKKATVFIPKGCYLVSSLFLKSDITLYIDKDAKILAKTNRKEFPIFPGVIGKYNFGIWEGSEVNNFASILNCIDIENTAIVGEGEIDCQAKNSDWYINHRQMNIAYRGHAIFSNRSKNITVIGLYIHDTQSWAIHPYFSKNCNFYNLHIKNDPNMPTTDGIDPDCCQNIKIEGCIFDVGDDCIAIKSGTYELAKKYKTPCSDIYIANNLMKQGHGGVVFGSESSGGIKNITVEGCYFLNTDRGLRIKTRRGRGNLISIDNINFSNIIMDGVKTPFVINMYYNMGPKGGHDEYVWTTKKLPVDELTPKIGHMHFRNMKCFDVSYAAGVFLGLPESKIEKVVLENIEFTYDKNAEAGYPVMIEHNFQLKRCGLYCFNVESIETKNVRFNGVLTEEIINKKSEE